MFVLIEKYITNLYRSIWTYIFLYPWPCTGVNFKHNWFICLWFSLNSPSTHTHFSPKDTRLLVNVLVSAEESLLVRRFLIKTPLGKPRRLLVKLLLLLLNNKHDWFISVLFPKCQVQSNECWRCNLTFQWASKASWDGQTTYS